MEPERKNTVGNDRAINSYRDLRVWQNAMALAEVCYRLTRRFPHDEIYGMTSQIRRAAASIPANIAEGNGRENRGEYIQFLRLAQGSLKELETHLLLSGRVELAAQEAIGPVLEKCEVLGKMLRGLIRALQNRKL
jgi:four helix bundle protein